MADEIVPPVITSIAGVARRAPEILSFVLPILGSASGDFYWCDPTSPDVTVLLPTGQLGEESHIFETSSPLASFKFPLYGYEIMENYFVLGNAWALCAYLQKQAESDKEGAIFSPAQRRAIGYFSDELSAWPDLASTIDLPIDEQLIFID